MIPGIVNPTPEGVQPQSICGKFGARRNPMYPCRWWADDPDGRRHTGIDVAAPYRSPILSPLPGVVAVSGWSNGGGGWRIYIRHNVEGRDLYSFHMHMAHRPFQQVGDLVQRGERVGLVGSTGSSIASHNHTGLVWDTPYPVLGYLSPLYIDPEPLYYETQEDDDMGPGDPREKSVKKLQRNLNRHDAVTPKLKPDGDYGPATTHAVEQVQFSRNLTMTGTVDNMTSYYILHRKAGS